MRNARSFRLGLAGLLAYLLTSPAMAADSRQSAVMARAMWTAFECSTLASAIGKPQEQQRLFRYGHEQGQRFVAAWRAGQVSAEHLAAEAPMVPPLLVKGPTTDFMLGRIYEAAQQSAIESVSETGEYKTSAEARLAASRTQFWERNCQLIGGVP